MFDPDSRYYELETAYLEVRKADGTTQRIAYKRRRFLPPLEGGQALAEHPVKEGDRLDNITAAYLGEPTQFFQIADANNVLRPQELVEQLGRRVKITLPNL
jgi:hypothetical protein